MTTYVRVPQADGEVVLNDGTGPRTYTVTDHLIGARSKAEAAELLRVVPDAATPTKKQLESRGGNARGAEPDSEPETTAGIAPAAAAPPVSGTPVSGAAAPNTSR